uniref:Porin family protein n=1 Tax=Roseihalotalea indica TaxID=2867963 RepID=A0AA49JG80_9BACT|nr:porin family protein [Tunicatimonas sp. TK19036]
MKFEQLTFYRTRIYIGLLLCIITASAHGQAQDSLANYKKWSIGFKGGAALSFIIPTDEAVTYERSNIGISQGITYGGVVRYMTEKNFGLQIEANYVEKGWTETFADLNDPQRRDPNRFYRVNLNYLEVPVLAYGYFGKRNVQIFVNLGMFGATLLSYDTEQAPTVDTEEISYQYLASEQNTFDLGIRGGTGIAIATKVGTFQAEGTYSLSLNSVLDRNRMPVPSMLLNNSITITLGYLVQF